MRGRTNVVSDSAGKDVAPPVDDMGGGPLTAAQVRARWDRGMKDTAEARRSYWVNHLFTSGEQWLRYSRTMDRFDRVPNDSRIQVVDNRLLPAQRTILGKLLKRRLQFEVLPSGSDDASLRGARLGEAVLTHAHRRQAWERVRAEHALVTWKGGTGGVCVDWDPEADVPLGVDNETGRSFGTGDVRLTPLSITEMCTEPGARDIRRAGWWIRGMAMPLQDAKQTYKLAELPPADAAAGAPLSSALNVWDPRRGNSSARSEMCLALTCYQRPQRDVKGQVVTVIDKQVVDERPWPFPFTDHLNIDVCVETLVEGRWFGMSVVSAAIQLQVALNITRSTLVEHMVAAGFAQRMAPMGSIERIDDLSDDPREILEYLPTPGGKPIEYLTPPSMPTWWTTNYETWYRAIDDVLGTHDISRGQAPTNVDSGVALSLLAEQDDTPAGLLAGAAGDMWGRIGSDVLELLSQNVTETRRAMVPRKSGRPEAVGWKGRDLEGQTEADVPRDAVMPRSRSAQLQTMLNLTDRGYFGTPPDPIKAFRFAEMQGAEDAVNAFNPDIARAERENDEMCTADTVDGLANVPMPLDFDNHAVHVEVHNGFRKSARYEQMAAPVRKIVDDHVLAHQHMSQLEMQAQASLAQVNPAVASAAQAHQPPLSGEPLPPGGAAPGPPPPPMTGPPGGVQPPQPPDVHPNVPNAGGPQLGGPQGPPQLMSVPNGGNPQ